MVESHRKRDSTVVVPGGVSHGNTGITWRGGGVEVWRGGGVEMCLIPYTMYEEIIARCFGRGDDGGGGGKPHPSTKLV